jgi:hypothetical protein
MRPRDEQHNSTDPENAPAFEKVLDRVNLGYCAELL